MCMRAGWLEENVLLVLHGRVAPLSIGSEGKLIIAIMDVVCCAALLGFPGATMGELYEGTLESGLSQPER